MNAPRYGRWLCCVALQLAFTTAIAAAPELRPFNATYSVNGTSGSADIQLEQLADGSWSYRQRIHVRSLLARLFMPAELSSRSLFTLENGRVTPRQFIVDDGPGSSSKDQKLDFDWTRGRVIGEFERKPVDLPIQPGLLDTLSVQVALMNELIAGQNPQRFVLVEKGRIREYAYSREGEETLRTDIGEYHTVIYRSSRAGSDKTTVFWCAPDLGYLPLKVERRDGRRVDVTLAIKTLDFSGAR